jgi:Uri superfamily endonuclease
MTIDINLLSGSGIYTLLLHVHKDVAVNVGKLGKQRFPRGYYSYTGSALGKGASLKNRVARHLRKEKRMFWHIDYLLADENVSVEAVIAVETTQKLECETNQRIKNLRRAEVKVKVFGASDCTKNCESHLLYFPDMENVDCLVQKIAAQLRSASGVLSVHLIC